MGTKIYAEKRFHHEGQDLDYSEITSCAGAKNDSFLQSVREARVGYDYPKELIGNMDEIPMYFDMSGNTTIDMKGIKNYFS